MDRGNWSFFIDVGGTFTDVVARRPDGSLITYKLLSTGAVRGVVGRESTRVRVKDHNRTADPSEFWTGYSWTLYPGNGQAGIPSRVRRFDSRTGELFLENPLESVPAEGTAYELHGPEEAPVLAIRYLMGLPLSEPIGPIDVRLGTTRATNALLERKGARVAFVTTRGFADVLKIGYQDRPDLFALHVVKRDELAERVIEIDERVAADGSVLRRPDEKEVEAALVEARDAGIETVAICLMHAHVSPSHEEALASIAERIGFRHVSVSSRVARMEKIVPRGDTTVLDACLTPVIKDYVTGLRRSMPQARLMLMSNNGGLMDAVAVSGKDTLLSGPAGGVVGCAHVARQAGYPRTIGFDMGGTSTDVCRVEAADEHDGFEYQLETVKAGVRIMTPMLAVETVAAGGGSICTFDGQKLLVGPHSAGADPGPACYGRGGPLTITDMNLALGRIVPEFFPFPLDRELVIQKLTELCKEVNAATGARKNPMELAEGFVQIANARMASAIRKISIARGYDLREYTLTTFGGAGAQHACAIARMLGMPRVLCNPYAGVLSAVGIGATVVKRMAQRTVQLELDDAARKPLKRILREIADELQDTLVEEGVSGDNLAPPTSTLELCYAGQATTIPVPVEPFEQARRRFEELHRQLYGYVHRGRGVEVRAVRVELAARGEPLELDPPRPKSGREQPKRPEEASTKMFINGQPRRARVYFRENLCAGQYLVGPAVVVEQTSTIVVDSGWEARVLDSGDLVLTAVASTGREGEHECSSSNVSPPAVDGDAAQRADPIRLELFNHQFAAAAEQMGATLRRTALSTNVKERLDFSCAVFTPEGDLVANAPHIPVHLGAMSDCVKSLIQDVSSFAPGEVYITNDPYRGGSHLNDVTVITPVHDDAGRRILFFVASRAHHAEIGGTRPGSMPPDSKSLAVEGVLIRATPWIKDGRPQHEKLLKLLMTALYPSRTPKENLADIDAQVAANQTGAHELKRMIERYGLDVVHAYMRHIQRAAEEKMRAALSKLPDGVHRFEDRMDDGTPIRVAITIDGDRAELDFTGTGPVHPGNLNANRSIVNSAVIYCLRCLIDEDIPLNAGVLAPIRIVLPECFLNPPYHEDPAKCPAVVGGNVETSQRIVDCIFGALGVVAASAGTMNNLLIGNERFGYYETICGGAGAGPDFHGADAVHTHMTNTRMTDPEILESRIPVRIVRFEIRRGSGGAGRFRGGCGVVRELEFLEPLEVSILSQRRTTAPYGLQGGSPGTSGINQLHRKVTNPGARGDTLPPIVHVRVSAGDRLTIATPGGGGWCTEPRP